MGFYTAQRLPTFGDKSGLERGRRQDPRALRAPPRRGGETLNPPPPSEGGGRVGYPGARGVRRGAKASASALWVKVPSVGPGPVHRTGPRPPRGRPDVRPARSVSPAELRQAGVSRRVAQGGRNGEGPPGRDEVLTRRGVSRGGGSVSGREAPTHTRAPRAVREGNDRPRRAAPGKSSGGRPRRDPAGGRDPPSGPQLSGGVLSRAPLRQGGRTGNDPSAGSPTETLLRLLLPLDSQV